MEAEHDELSSTVKTLQMSLKEKELRVANVEKKNESLIEEHENEMKNLQHQLNSLQTKLLEKEVRTFLPFFVQLYTVLLNVFGGC